ncbi:acetyl-CoA carboxylase biotin carboxyl carrier protein [Weissella uvarum]|uniref:acetyl-CoA carboxylase biotin carboxyl carrier protein n=1 Tax=Weissella uvarum TaxID=1479233 RepID=UPI00195FB2BE|nr:acetyl-CoA carboxylase biotin carboxyl carrier protein [Weissella uvarum]MCM0595896.1 acetyl-CoA carboxylase biotin carboxyl carrier protein [Weissella uvarum]
MELTLDEIKDLIQTIDASSLREFAVNEGDYSLHLSKNDAPQPVAAPVAPIQTDATAQNVAVPATEGESTEPTGTYVKAALVGTVYLRPNPDAEPFVKVGDHVNVGDQVALIEAMKLMTPVKTEVAGTVKNILVADEDMVDYDMNLIEIIPD